MIWINPCKKCLIQACCGEQCQDKEQFIKFQRCVSPYIVTIGIISVIAIVCYLVIFSTEAGNNWKETLFIVSFMWFCSFLFLLGILFLEILITDI